MAPSRSTFLETFRNKRHPLGCRAGRFALQRTSPPIGEACLWVFAISCWPPRSPMGRGARTPQINSQLKESPFFPKWEERRLWGRGANQYACSCTPLTEFWSFRQYACSCTPFTALPLGSFIFLNAASHSRAMAVEQATLASLGTLLAALSLGKCSAKMLR